MADGITMRPSDGAPWVFDPGALCLELLLTGGPGPLGRYESLREPGGLARWAAASRLRLDPASVHCGRDEPARAVRLRNALWRIMRNVARGRPYQDRDAEVVNAAAAEPPIVPRLVEGRREWAAPVTGTQLVSAVARDAVSLLTGPHAGRVHECGGADCHLIFVDTSPSGRRRWCSMERCGNRNKVRALRARQKEATA
ncbi:CGNR zinc finger domain-containing protein [Bailinhaonella thermotolerans]|uniref:Zf-CGNR multi-domain protein n=1 Tax=Bailinhaonella thermotolerans TaxID=1070861 RepID=A0A3A4BCP8_9ACTN|nr:ABATE domain-containing protein [Bailinhaonella thermotolerans]RJL31978.1 zf-CGNR multi-domain protein [Bailinhaonella thermotolerans]